jgi:hypothetical protein
MRIGNDSGGFPRLQLKHYYLASLPDGLTPGGRPAAPVISRACRLRMARLLPPGWAGAGSGPAAQPMAVRCCHPLTGCSLKALIPLNMSSLMMKE